jgi:transposase
MELRMFRALAAAGATWAEIARETGHDWRTVKRSLTAETPGIPPVPAKRGPGPRTTDPYAGLVDAWLRRQPKLKASVTDERLVASTASTATTSVSRSTSGSTGLGVCGTATEPEGLHRRFEVLPGAQAQVDWGRRRRHPDRDRAAAGGQLPHDPGVLP